MFVQIVKRSVNQINISVFLENVDSLNYFARCGFLIQNLKTRAKTN